MNWLNRIVFALLMLASATMIAQPSPPTADQMAQRELVHYASLLTLSSEQQAAALEIFTAEAANAEALRTTERGLRKTLHSAISANSTAVISETAASLGDISRQRITANSEAKAKFYQLLTAAQREQFEAVQDARPGGEEKPMGPPPD